MLPLFFKKQKENGYPVGERQIRKYLCDKNGAVPIMVLHRFLFWETVRAVSLLVTVYDTHSTAASSDLQSSLPIM